MKRIAFFILGFCLLSASAFANGLEDQLRATAEVLYLQTTGQLETPTSDAINKIYTNLMAIAQHGSARAKTLNLTWALPKAVTFGLGWDEAKAKTKLIEEFNQRPDDFKTTRPLKAGVFKSLDSFLKKYPD